MVEMDAQVTDSKATDGAAARTGRADQARTPGGAGGGEGSAGLHSAELLEATFASMGQAVVVYGPAGELLRVNAAAEQILGVSMTQLAAARGPEGRAALLQIQTADAAPMPLEEMPFWKALRGEPSRNVEMRFRTPGGEPRFVSASAAPLRGPSGERLGTVVTFSDVTDRKEAERTLVESEQNLRVSFAHAAIGFARTTPDGRFLDANPAYCTVVGYTPEELRGKDFPELIHPDDRAANMAQIERMLGGELSDFVVENRYLRKGGGVVWVRKSVSVVRGPAGEPQWIIALIEDVTERHRAEQAVRESEARLRLLAEALPQLVWTADEQGDLDFFNQRWRDYTGQAAGAEAWEPVLHPEDREQVMGLWREAIARQVEVEVEHRLRRADGAFRWFLRRAILLKQPGGAGGRWFGTCTDIHDLKVSQDLLRQADRLKEDFLSMASHEFRTPLTALRLQMELLERRLRRASAPDERQERQLVVVRAQLDRLEGLLGMLLDVTRINAGKFTLEPAELDLGELALEVVERFRPEAEESGTELHVRAGCVKGSWDRMRLDQVVTNLVGNAIKYGNHRPVEVEVEERGGAAVLVVRDRGIGIQPEGLTRIFDRFERGGNVGPVQGLGLGLWIARKLVDAHGGRISVESTPGAGTCFTVSLPVAPPGPG